MKKIAFASILTLFLLGFATPRSASAQTASGTYQFSLEDDYTKQLEFDARTLSDGTATGQMFFSDQAKITIQDVDGTGDKEITYPGYYVKADFDGLVVDKNQAVMSGTIRDSSIREFIGQRVLLTVEDNGDNIRVPDKLTWGVYRPIERGWTPSDAERKEDPGVGLRWYAKDAERRDDVGYWMPRSETINTSSFSLPSYAFVDTSNGAGDIVVR
jgi:hypothetical protein